MLNILKQQPMKPVHTLLSKLRKPHIQRLLVLLVSGMITLLPGGIMLLPDHSVHAVALSQTPCQTYTIQPGSDTRNQQDPIEQKCKVNKITLLLKRSTDNEIQ